MVVMFGYSVRLPLRKITQLPTSVKGVIELTEKVFMFGSTAEFVIVSQLLDVKIW